MLWLLIRAGCVNEEMCNDKELGKQTVEDKRRAAGQETQALNLKLFFSIPDMKDLFNRRRILFILLASFILIFADVNMYL